jgi:G3E family GTPase
VILLNKADLAPAETLSSTETLIHQINPAAPVYQTVRGQIDLSLVMGINAYSSRSVFPPSKASHLDNNHDHDHDHAPDDHAPTHYEIRGISSLQVSVPALDEQHLAALDAWIRTVLWDNRLPADSPSPSVDDSPTSLEVLRCKGIFRLQNGANYVLQGVRNLYEMMEVDVSNANSVVGVADHGKLVLIGKGLGDEVRNSLLRVLQ